MTGPDRTITRRELRELANTPGVNVRVEQKVRTASGREVTITDGSILGSADGHSRYIVSNMHRGGLTVRRELPRARGKAARRAEKAQRRRDREQREHNERLELRRQDRQARAELEA